MKDENDPGVGCWRTPRGERRITWKDWARGVPSRAAKRCSS